MRGVLVGGLLVVVLNNPRCVQAINKRFQGTAGRYCSGDLWSGKVGSVIDCTKRCLAKTDCGMYSYQRTSGQCQLNVAGSSDWGTGNEWILFKTVTSTSNPRNPSVSVGNDYQECPVVFREWSLHADNTTFGEWTGKVSSTADGQPSDIWDGDNSTTIRTNPSAFPWLQINFGKPMAITRLYLTAGNESLTNLDFRIGDSDYSNYNGDQRITGNQRCNLFHGPTRTYNEQAIITCNAPMGLMGKFLTIQQTERYTNNALEIAELRLEGFARVCDVQDQFLSS